MKPKLFIASSKKSIKIAQALRHNLDSDAEITPWNESFFELSKATLHSLIDNLDAFDFGIFVLNADDKVIINAAEQHIPRDNVVLELGLFVGRLGIERVFVVEPEGKERVHLPTDLLGLTTARFNPDREDRNFVAALGKASDQIRDAIEKYGRKTKMGLPFYTRADKTVPSRIQNAKFLDMMGTSLHSMSGSNMSVLKDLKERGCKIRFVISDPNDERLNYVYTKRFADEHYASLVKPDLERFKALVGTSASGGSFEIKVTNYDVSYSYIGIDTILPTGKISVEMYLTKVSLVHNPMFDLDKGAESPWFEIFKDQFEKFWNS